MAGGTADCASQLNGGSDVLIQINDQYRITSDTHNIIIEERRVSGDKAKNPGEERWVATSFHRTVQQAAEWLFHHSIRVAPDSDLNTLLQVLAKSHRELIDALSQVKSFVG